MKKLQKIVLGAMFAGVILLGVGKYALHNEPLEYIGTAADILGACYLIRSSKPGDFDSFDS